MASSNRPGLTLRARLLLAALGAVLPLALLGLLVSWRAIRSGESLLRSQLEDQLTRAEAEVQAHWLERRSDLLLLAENEPARLALRAPAPPGARAAPDYVRQVFAQVAGVDRIVVRDRGGAVRWQLGSVGGPTVFSTARPDTRIGPSTVLTVTLPVTDLLAGDTIGSLEADVRGGALLPSIARTESRTGPLLAVRLPGGRYILPQAADATIFGAEHTEWDGRHWLSVRRALPEPALELIVAGALDPYVAPFARAARNGAVVLLAGAVLALLIVLAATRRVSRDVAELVAAAEAVSAGDLGRRVEVRGGDEIARIAVEFNAMTDSLQRTLQDLARREALAAIGEFATELAHEIRNPLTSMRLDLARLDEVSGDRAATRAILTRTLSQIARLDRAVTGALRASRGAPAEPRPVPLQDVLDAAQRTAEAEFTQRGARLDVSAPPVTPVWIEGDAAGLEQLFLNLFANAAQALPSGGCARVSTEITNGAACVTVADDGPGMTEEQLRRVQQAFYSTKRDGTGLGLKIARRIAVAHGGVLTVHSAPGAGTRVLVTLPVCRDV